MSMKLTGNRLATGDALKRVVERHAGPYLQRAGMIIEGGHKDETFKFRKTGTLSRSFSTSRPEWKGTRIRVEEGTNIVYARLQNEATKNSGYIKRGYDSTKEAAKREVGRGMQEVARHLVGEAGRY
jgi:hypothetical protein